MGFLPVPRCGRRRQENPHMRAFWAATLAFTFAFIGWFAFAPLLVYVRKDIGICDNDVVVQKDIEGAKCECGKGTQCKLTISNAKGFVKVAGNIIAIPHRTGAASACSTPR